MNKYLVGLVAAMVFMSCIEKPEYFTTEGGVKYKLLDFTEDETKPEIGQYLSLHTTYYTSKDSIFHSSADFRFNNLEFHQLAQPDSGTFEEVLSELQVGDSAMVLINAESFFVDYLEAEVPHFVDGSEELKIHVRLIEAKSYDDYIADRAAESDWMEMKELADIKKYIGRSGKAYSDINGVHVAILHSDFDSTKRLSYGDLFQLNYEGSFLNNGNVFYSTYRNGFPDEFSYGRQGQLIDGLDIALSGRMYGDSLEVVIPSLMAFGEKGSAGGIVPPYSTLKYTLRISDPGDADTTSIKG